MPLSTHSIFLCKREPSRPHEAESFPCFRARIKSYWENVFCLDTRSLALFRIVLALLLLSNLVARSSDLVPFYTDEGVLPRSALVAHFPALDSLLSIHLLGGSSVFQAALFLLTGLCAGALLVGYQTRWATFCCWLLVTSLHNRDPWTVDSGDTLLHLLLFWSLFLPLGASYSIDNALSLPHHAFAKRVSSVGKIAFTLQICFLYWFSVAFKASPEWHSEGTAVYYALNLNDYATRWGQLLVHSPFLLLLFLTRAIFWTETLAPFLLFAPFFSDRLRTLVVFLFLCLHIGLAICLELGQFSHFCCAAWLALLPSGFWEAIEHRWPQRRDFTLFFDDECAFCRKGVSLLLTFLGLPKTAALPAQVDPRAWDAVREHQSWMLVDRQGKDLFGFDVFVALIQLSRVGRLGWLLKSKPFCRIGEQFYRFIARNRNKGLASVLGAILEEQPNDARTPKVWQILAGCFLLYTLSWNLMTLDPPRYGVLLPSDTRWIAPSLDIGQKWQLFPSFTHAIDGWLVMPAQLRNGQVVDLFRNGAPVSWRKPQITSALYPNHEWRKYLRRLRKPENAWARPYYASYICNQWNRLHPASQQIVEFKIYFMRERHLLNNQTQLLKPQLLWEQGH